MSHATENISPKAEPGCCHTDEMKSKAAELRHNVQDLGSHAKLAAQEQVQNLKQSASQYMDQGREQMDAWKNSAADYMEQGRHHAMELERTLESRIRAQPMRAVLISAGIGLVAGILLCRR